MKKQACRCIVASENRVRAGGKVQQKLSRDGGGGASELVGTRGAQQAFQHEVRGLLVGVSPSAHAAGRRPWFAAGDNGDVLCARATRL